jgi:hypothetical protein
MRPAMVMNRLRALLVLLPVALGAPACGFIFTHAPPQGYETMTEFSCTESNAGPIVDVVWASLNVLGALAAASEPDTYDNSSEIVAVGLTWGLVSGAAAIVGFGKTKRCREAKLDQDQSMYRAVPISPVADTTVAGVTVTPARDTLLVGAERQLVAAAYSSAGVMIPLKRFRWSSSNDAIASVSNTGLVIAHAPGTVVIAANSENVVGTASIVVLDRE